MNEFTPMTPEALQTAPAIEPKALRNGTCHAASPVQQAPLYVSWGVFTMSRGGLYQTVTKGQGDNKTSEDVWISGPLEILGRSRDPASHSWGRWVRWHDPDNKTHNVHVYDAELQGDPASLCARLAGMGLQIDRARQRAFVSYLGGCKTNGRVLLVNRTGWHDKDGTTFFVLPSETIGPVGSEHVILDDSATGPYDRKGSLKNWQRKIATPAGDHLLCVLAISTALAGPLLHLAGQEGGGVHFWGESSKGKTTLLQIIATVWGKGSSSGGYVRSWRATGNALEGAAASATDTALILDELGQVDGRDAGVALYGLSNGAGKQRAGRDGSLRDAKTWRVLTISSGEIPVESKLSEDCHKKPRAGQLVRMLDIPIDRSFGVFDNNGDGDAGKIAKTFKQAALEDYGHAGPEFVRLIIAKGAGDGDIIREMVSRFVATNAPNGSDGQIDRAAQRLGLIAAAGEFASQFKLVPWPAERAREAAVWALKQWIEARGGVEPMEHRQALEQVRGLIGQYGESRFDNLDEPGAPPVNNRLGWRKGFGPGREWLIPPQIWKSIFCEGLNSTSAARVLCDLGALRRSNDAFSVVRTIAGNSQRVFCLTYKVIEGHSDAG